MSVDGEVSQKDLHRPDHPNSVGLVTPKKMVLTEPFVLEAGGALDRVEMEYETYGELSPAKDNAVLICHALTGDAHVAGWDLSGDGGDLRAYRQTKPGWWDTMVGPGKAIDTSRFLVICCNVLGSCYGTSGPSSVNPADGKPWGLRFPVVTVGDWARQQFELLRALGIPRLRAVIGGSMGGQMALEMALSQPDTIDSLIILSAGHRVTNQGLAFDAVGRHAIIHDSDFKGGDYYGGPRPISGLAAARMMAQITYLSEESMGHKFGRRLRGKDAPEFTLTGVEFEMESYLSHQAESFVKRYDPNSYLYMTRAMDYYDAAHAWGQGDLAVTAAHIKADTMVVSFSSDWLFPPELCRELVSDMCQARRPVSYVNVPSRYGHDAFLVETETVRRLITSFLKNH